MDTPVGEPVPEPANPVPDPMTLAMRHVDEARQGATDLTAAAEYVYHEIEAVSAHVENIRRAVAPDGPLVGAAMKVNTNVSALGHRLKELAARQPAAVAVGVVAVVVGLLVAVGALSRPAAAGAAPRHELIEVTTVGHTHFDRAYAAMRRRDYRAAAGHFAAAGADGGDPTLALGGRAECLYYLREYDEAIACCDKLNAAVPNAGRAHYVRGLVWLANGRTEAAHDQFRQAVRHGDALAASLLPSYRPATTGAAK